MPERKGPKAIYALVDPKDETVFYVGASYKPELRWKQHCKGAEDPTGILGEEDVYGTTTEKIREISRQGLTPQLRILAPAADDWRAKERWWQHRFRATLLNVRIPDGPHLDVRPAIAQALQALRAESGMTRESVAEALDCTPTTVYRWENNMRSPGVNDLAALSMTYGVEPSAFFPSRETIAQAIQSISATPKEGS